MLEARQFSVLLATATLFLTVACGGSGGDGGGGGGGAIQPSYAASFTPDQTNPGNLTVSLGQAAGGVGDQVILAVNVTDTNDVYGAELTVTFDPAAAQFISRSSGTLLEAGGNAVIYDEQIISPGRLLVAVTRLGAMPGADVSGTAALVNLRFQAISAGTSAVSFENALLLDSQPPAPGSIPGLSWFGGTLVAN